MVRFTLVPGGPTTITSLKLYYPAWAVTDFDFITVTFGEKVLIVAVLEKSVIIGRLLSSRSCKEMLPLMRLPLTRGCERVSTSEFVRFNAETCWVVSSVPLLVPNYIWTA